MYKSMKILTAFMITTITAQLNAASSESIYKLPPETEALIQQSSVIVSCAGNTSSGVAISARHFMTAAHGIIGAVVGTEPVYIMAPKNEKPIKTCDVLVAPPEADGMFCVRPIETPDFKCIKGHLVHLPTGTTTKEGSKGISQKPSVSVLREQTREQLAYGEQDAISFAATGAGTKWIHNTDAGCSIDFHGVWGPDVAIIECLEPHGVEPVKLMLGKYTEETLFISGVAGKRYTRAESPRVYAGAFGTSRDDESTNKFWAEPKVYAQSFRSLPASSENPQHRLWINKVSLRTKPDGSLLLEDEFHVSEEPEGFGLITGGDSGSGAFIVKGGVPRLAGIVSKGEIALLPRALNQFFETHTQSDGELLPGIIAGLSEDVILEMRAILRKPWPVIEALVDTQPLARWIVGIIK
jgi:hypothetical protein